MTTPAAASALYGTASIGSLIMTAIARYPERIALKDDHLQWTYRELGEAISRIMQLYAARGLKKGDGLAVLAANRVEQMACQFAASLMGMRYTALHPLASRDTQRYVLNDAEIAALVVDGRIMTEDAAVFREGAPGLRQVFSLGPVASAVDVLEAMSDYPVVPLRDDADPDGLAYLFYTGGTTGKPKGVMLPHRSIVMAAVLQATDWDLPNGDIRFLAMTPISHASGIVVPTVFMRGGTVRLAPGFSVDEFCRIVAADAINMAFIVPTMLYALLESAKADTRQLASLETVVYGAAPMSPAKLRQGIERYGNIFVQLYGQTEIPMCITALRKIDHESGRQELLQSCGLPCSSVQIKLLDPELREVPTGQPGEICVRSNLVMGGYWKQPEATAETFRGDWMHTGDVAIRSPEGYLTIVDRTKDLIITGGFNVYPREVEDALLTHPGVQSAVVVGVPDEKWGEAVVACVVRSGGADVDADTLKATVKALRGGVWVPKDIRFVDAIPLTPLGKLDRKAVREMYAR